MFGISIFLGEELTTETVTYIKKMKAIGFDGIFTSLHIPEDDASLYSQRLAELGAIAKAEQMKVMVDISGEALKRAGFSFDDLDSLTAMGVTGLRMDYGITNQQMALASHKIDIGLNASTITLEDVSELKKFEADFSRMEAWHNYYPRPETGISESFFNEKNRWLKALGFQVFAFVAGDGQKRGPVFAGLPTLESQRNANRFAAAVTLSEDEFVDAVYIGDPSISERAMQQFDYFRQNAEFLLEVENLDSHYFDLILGEHENRPDEAQAVIRSALARMNEVPLVGPELITERLVGMVTIDNQLYGRYMGESQYCCTSGSSRSSNFTFN